MSSSVRHRLVGARRRVVHRRDVDRRRGSVAGQRPARPGIAVVVHRQDQCRAGGRRIAVVDIAHGAGRVGFEQRVDLRHRAADRHRRAVVVGNQGPAAARRHRQRALAHRQRHRHRAATGIDIADRQPGVLQLQGDLLGRAIGTVRIRRHRRVVHSRQVHGRRGDAAVERAIVRNPAEGSAVDRAARRRIVIRRVGERDQTQRGLIVSDRIAAR